MNYDREFLQNLAEDKICGDFHPFDSGDSDKVDIYIKQILGTIGSDRKIILQPDFNSYGSGYASYIPVKVSRANESDSVYTNDRNKTTKHTKAIQIYICRLAPFWYYGASEWTASCINGKFSGASSDFLSPEKIDLVDLSVWGDCIQKIKEIFIEFRYQLLTRTEVEKRLDFNTKISSNIADLPYKVFDCFFHWED